MNPEPEVMLARANQASAQWDGDHAALMRDHAQYRSRLDAAILFPTREDGRVKARPVDSNGPR